MKEDKRNLRTAWGPKLQVERGAEGMEARITGLEENRIAAEARKRHPIVVRLSFLAALAALLVVFGVVATVLRANK